MGTGRQESARLTPSASFSTAWMKSRNCGISEPKDQTKTSPRESGAPVSGDQASDKLRGIKGDIEKRH